MSDMDTNISNISPRVCLIHVDGPRGMIMSQLYTEYLKKNDVPYDMITMSRNNEKDEVDALHHYCYVADMSDTCKKIKSYIGYRKYVRKLLAENKYRFAIIWSEVTAALFSDILLKDFEGKYCVNVRDILVGKRTLFNRSLRKAICNSAFTTVSSEKYLDYLPQYDDKYYFIHSFNHKIMSEINEVVSRKEKSVRTDGRITILFLGGVRFYSHFFRLIDEIGNDDRYRFIVAGYADEPVREYVKEKKINNVEFYGSFETSKTAELLSQADVLYNLYGTEDINLRTALSNKLYYAICLNIPLLAYKDTYTFEMADKAGVGFAVDDSYNNHSFADDFYKWYKDQKKECVRKKCDLLIDEAKDTQKILLERFEKELKDCDAL